MTTVGSLHFFDFAPNVVRMPEPDQFQQDAAGWIVFAFQEKVGDHYSVSQEQHLAFTAEPPVSALSAKLLLELAGKVCFQTTVERAATFEMRMQRTGGVKLIGELLECLGRTH